MDSTRPRPSGPYDVVIVGAGPAGLNCARRLRGRSVLVLERNDAVGPKVCAGGLTSRCLEYLGLPAGLVDRRFDRIVVHGPRRTVEVAFPVATVDRGRLGRWMAEGLDVRVGARVTEVGDHHVVVNGEERIGYRYLVGADGAGSIVRRHLGLPSHRVIHAVQYVVEPDGYDDLEVYFEPDLFGAGYAWVFPHGSYASVGCRHDPRARGLGRSLLAWLGDRGIDVSRGIRQDHAIPCDYRGHRFGDVFLAGDAAGVPSFLTGEGIYQALVSGEEVANVIDGGRSGLLDGILRSGRIHNLIVEIIEGAGPWRRHVVGAGVRVLGHRTLGPRLMGS